MATAKAARKPIQSTMAFEEFDRNADIQTMVRLVMERNFAGRAVTMVFYLPNTDAAEQFWQRKKAFDDSYKLISARQFNAVPMD